MEDHRPSNIIDLTGDSAFVSNENSDSSQTLSSTGPTTSSSQEHPQSTRTTAINSGKSMPFRIGSRQKRKLIGNEIEPAVAIPKRLRVSEKLPKGKPQIWAVRRQHLCETLPYFKAYQASWYTKNGVALSFLLCKDETPRSYMDSNIIIARGPGGTSADKEAKGSRQRTKSHTEDESEVRAIRLACKTKASIIVLASNKCEDLPSTMPHNFQVLDQYWVTNYWWEQDNGYNVFKYRLERIDLGELPWFAPSHERFSPPQLSTPCDAACCWACGRVYIKVYQHWMCLNLNCDRFWKLPNGNAPGKQSLTFDEEFLKKRTPFPGQIRFNQVPTPFNPLSHRETQYAYSSDSWQGFWCDQCGLCTSREHWNGWQCACGVQRSIAGPLLNPAQANLIAKHNSVSQKRPVATSIILPERQIVGKYQVDIFEIDGANRVFHFRSCHELNAQPNGPDQLFQELQLANNMNLKRKIVGTQSDETATASLTRHFSQNFGLPYKYVVAQDSTPFKDAPPPICRALQRLIWAGRLTGMDEDRPFNEMLVVGYMTSGSMNYHDDGEESLGSTVSTLSLGGDAIMRFRAKRKYYHPPLDFQTGKFIPDQRVLPGVPLEKERHKMSKWIASKPEATEQDMVSQFKKYTAVKTYLKGRIRFEKHEDLVQIMLKHGDICVMQGADLQKYIEHKVKPLGCLRFALTSRHILPHLVSPGDRHMGDVDLSTYPEYDGSKDCTSSADGVRGGSTSEVTGPEYDLTYVTSTQGYDSGMEF